MGAPWPDPWVTIAFLAGQTTTLRFFTNIYVLPARPPVAVAKLVGTAAVLSGNRVALGIGMGWMEEEFDAMEQPFAGRGRRADEMLDVIRTLWTGEVVEHHGAHYDLPPLEVQPVPSEPVPVWVGGTSDAALRRAARNDGWISDLHTTDELRAIRARIDGFRREYGRDHLPFAMVGRQQGRRRPRRLPAHGRRRRHPPHDLAVGLLRGARGHAAAEARRHPPLRRRRHRPLVTAAPAGLGGRRLPCDAVFGPDRGRGPGVSPGGLSRRQFLAAGLGVVGAAATATGLGGYVLPLLAREDLIPGRAPEIALEARARGRPTPTG